MHHAQKEFFGDASARFLPCRTRPYTTQINIGTFAWIPGQVYRRRCMHAARYFWGFTVRWRIIIASPLIVGPLLRSTGIERGEIV